MSLQLEYDEQGLIKPEFLPALPDIASRLKWLRHAHGWTQAQLAQMAGVTDSLVAQIEIGRSRRPRAVDKLAKAAKVTPGWLVFGQSDVEDLSSRALEFAKLYDELPLALQREVEKVPKKAVFFKDVD